MATLPLSTDGQAIALACSTLALAGDRSIKPLSAGDWHELSITVRAAGLRPRDLLGRDDDELRDLLGIGGPQAILLAELMSRGGQLGLEVERLSSLGIWVLSRADDEYPSLLKKRLRGQTPPLLFGAGPREILSQRSIAVVGSRDVGDDGLAFTERLAQRCARQDFAVVSGGARGTDLTAMLAAVSVGGKALGFTVDPLERLIRRRELREAITDGHLTLATPFHPAARWYASNAMRRNRLIYAASHAAVVVASSAEKGGTRAGALENLRGGWVPLHVRDDGSPGNRRLLGDGAMSLPADASLDELDVERLTQGRQPSLLDPASHEPERPADVDAEDEPPEHVGDLFLVAWPILARQLHEPVGERELAERTALQPVQARAWLQRAVDEGLADVVPRPKRYVVRSAEQLRLGGA